MRSPVDNFMENDFLKDKYIVCIIHAEVQTTSIRSEAVNTLRRFIDS